MEKQQSLPQRLEISEFRPPVHALKIQIQIKDYLGLEVIRIAQVISKLTQPQNSEKEPKLNSFFEISLDL